MICLFAIASSATKRVTYPANVLKMKTESLSMVASAKPVAVSTIRPKIAQ